MDIPASGGRRAQPNLIFALFMILAGILLFLSNLGLLPIHHVWDYWPLLFVAIGLSRIVSGGRPSALVVGGLFIVLGILFTLFNTGLLRLHLQDDSWPLSLVFLALGIAGLAKALDGGRRNRPPQPQALAGDQDSSWRGYVPSDMWSKYTQSDNSSIIQNFALWASVNRKVESPALEGGSLMSLMGSIEIDLRRSRLADGAFIVVDANAVMGSIKLRVPEAWRVVWNGVQVMGSFEDKTIPQMTAAAVPQLVLTGYVFMGSIEVES